MTTKSPNLKQAIVKTLCYADVFSYPLTSREIHGYLIGKSATYDQVQKHLQKMDIKSNHKYYYFGDNKNIDTRKKRHKIAIQKLKIAQKYAKILKLLSSIQAVCITGALAMENANIDDDIDLLIITKSGRLWSTRFFTNLLFDTFNLRRKPLDIKFNNKACLNLWLTTNNLAISKHSQNLYSAHEVAQVKFIWDRGGIADKFLYQNRWIKKFLPNIIIPESIHSKLKKSKASFIESILFKLQQKIMKSKKTSERVSLNHAFFHPRNTKKIVLAEYNKRIKKYGILTKV